MSYRAVVQRGQSSRRQRLGILLTSLLGLALATVLVSIPRKRRVTVTFDYDFKSSPACSATSTLKCVQQFNVYDITGRRRELLFSIPVRGVASGLVKGIRGTSQPLPLLPGKHVLAVTAQSADGSESDANACTTTVNVKR